MAFQRSKKIYDEPALYEYAVAALGRRMRTAAELRRMLRARAPQDEAGGKIVESVIARLIERQYLDDAGYAAAFSALRRDNEKFGKRRVSAALKTKGVSREVVEKAVERAYSDVEEVELARAFLARKRLKRPSTNLEAAKVFRALLRAGFSSSTAVSILKDWDVEEEAISAFQEEAIDPNQE